jgi:hypothetical protein
MRHDLIAKLLDIQEICVRVLHSPNDQHRLAEEILEVIKR